jgi:hypothetical protein
LNRLSQTIESLRKIPIALRRGGHPARSRHGIPVLPALIAKEKSRRVVSEKPRNQERAADIERSGEAAVGRLRSVLSRKRIGPRVQRGVVCDEGRIASEEGNPPYVVADAEGLAERGCRGIVEAAINEKTVGRAQGELLLAQIGERAGLWESGIRRLHGPCVSRIDIGLAKSRLIELPLDLAPVLRCPGERGRRRYLNDLGADLFNREYLQFESGGRPAHFLPDSGEARHFHLDGARPFGQVRKVIRALPIRNRGGLLFSLDCRYDCARHGSAIKHHMPLMRDHQEKQIDDCGHGRLSHPCVIFRLASPRS